MEQPAGCSACRNGSGHREGRTRFCFPTHLPSVTYWMLRCMEVGEMDNIMMGQSLSILGIANEELSLFI